MALCNACHHGVGEPERIVCSVCSKTYHYGCVNISKENFNKLSSKTKSTWKCPECKLPRRRGDNSNTPVKDDVSVYDEHPQQDSLEKKLNQFESSLLLKMQSIFRTEFEALQRDVRLIPELVKTVEFLSSRYDTVSSELSKLKAESSTLREENVKLTDNIKELSSKMNIIEQHARECNLEIQCLPEHPRENLVNTVLQLGKVISCPLEEKDVLSCTRVAKSNPKSTRPKTVIVKLPSPRMRDSMLACCLKYNKAHSKDKLNSSLLGLAGNRVQIFLSEHLSPSNRSLHAQARLLRKDGNYKYLWVRNGRILVRKNDESPVLWIRNSEMLQELKL